MVSTVDGSYTLYDKDFDECYHSVIEGAFTETLQKHVIPAFEAFGKRSGELDVLDICFGLGFNTLATIWYVKKHYPGLKINIFSPEINEELVRSLKDFQYPSEFDELGIIEKVAEDLRYDDGKYKIEVAVGDARKILGVCERKFDIVYQDAFSPKKNPTLWTIEYFENIKRLLKQKSIITTYSKATHIRLSLYNLGFYLYENNKEGIRGGTLALNFEYENFKKVDMLTKLKNAPNTEVLKDEDLNAKR